MITGSTHRRTLLFRRTAAGASGGDLKVWDYFMHARKSTCYAPEVYLDGPPMPGSPWLGEGSLEAWAPERASAIFVGGLDWLAVPESLRVPVVNLVQGTRHADAGDPRRRFLRRRAVRICVSPEVSEAIAGTGEVNGPVYTIRLGLDTSSFPRPSANRDIPVLILGLKAPGLASDVAMALASRGVEPWTCVSPMARADLLHLLGRARVAVTLPLESEGMFLIPLEAMAMGAIVVCPSVPGTRTHVRDMDTAFAPARDAEAITTATLSALAMDPDSRSSMAARAEADVGRHRIARERRHFLTVLGRLDEEYWG